MLASSRTRWARAAGLLALSLTLTACGIGSGNSDSGPEGSSIIDTGETQGAVPSTTANPLAGEATAEVAGATPAAESASVRLSSNQVSLGNLNLTLAVDTPHRIVTSNAPAAAPTAQGWESQGGSAPQVMVLGGQTQQLRNIEAQGPPADPTDSQGDYLRYVSVQVKDRTTGQVVPYLVLSVDMLKDGRPVQSDQPLAAVVPEGGTTDQMHYGNNLVFPGKGNYQLFVRVAESPLLGNQAPPTAQFDVAIE